MISQPKIKGLALALLMISTSVLHGMEQKSPSLWKKITAACLSALVISSGASAAQPELPSTCLTVFNGNGDLVDYQHCARNLESLYDFKQQDVPNWLAVTEQYTQEMQNRARATNLCVPYYSRFRLNHWETYLGLLCTTDAYEQNIQALNEHDLTAPTYTDDKGEYVVLEYSAETNFIPNENTHDCDHEEDAQDMCTYDPFDTKHEHTDKKNEYSAEELLAIIGMQ